ncbi:unnamed protein product [Caretta caretta]
MPYRPKKQKPCKNWKRYVPPGIRSLLMPLKGTGVVRLDGKRRKHALTITCHSKNIDLQFSLQAVVFILLVTDNGAHEIPGVNNSS